MKLYRAKDYKDMSRKAANIISAQVIMKPNCVLGLATGSTPIGTYEQLVEWYKKGDLDFAEVKTANLDEYGCFPDEDAVMKLLYLRVKELYSRWGEGCHQPGWARVRNQLLCDEGIRARIERFL